MNIPRFSVKNPVAANLIMWIIIIGGVYCWFTLLREFFPDLTAEKATISINYPSATPEEVEKTITRRLEQSLEKVQDVDEISSTIVEGASLTTVTFDKGVDSDQALNEVRNAVDEAKTEFPDEVDDPEIKEQRPFIPVIIVEVFGDVSEDKLREEAKQVRDELLEYSEISQILMSGIREREIWVEVLPEKLEEHRLTHAEVGKAIAAFNFDLPGGELRGQFGKIRVRTTGENKQIARIEQIAVRSMPDGQTLRVKDIAHVHATFEDKVIRGQFDGKRAISVTVFKAPDQDAVKIAEVVKKYVKEHKTRLGGSVELATTTDLSRFISQRLELMLRNARLGFILVVLSLAFFLDLRVAFWVSSGLLISFLGTFVVMQIFGISINLISLFGLIIVLGLIVDDAIVVGENVFTHIRKGVDPQKAAIVGTNEVALPVTTAVFTTIVAFLPLAFLKGQLGEMMGGLPDVVIAALSISLVEAFLILPAHLGHRRRPRKRAKWIEKTLGFFFKIGEKRTYFLEETLPKYFERTLRFALHWRYITLALALSFSVLIFGFIAGGIIPFVFIQDVDAEFIEINLEMSAGTLETRTVEVVSQIENIVRALPETATIHVSFGAIYGEFGKQAVADPATVAQITLETLPADERESKKMRTCEQIINIVRKKTGKIPGVKSLNYVLRTGGPPGADIEILVKGKQLSEVSQAVDYVSEHIARYKGVQSVQNDLNKGKSEIRFELRESAHALGLTTVDLATQVRYALYGFEAQELQGENEEIKVRVLLPPESRRNLDDLSRLRILTPMGMRIPLSEVAVLSTARGYASLSRVDGKRAVTVNADIDEALANISEVTADLEKRFADIERRFPGITISFEGRKKETRESLGSLAVGFPVALLMIYSVIAILFNSYTQPLIVMGAIPYSIVGAIIGHLIMGYPLTFLSMIGGVALAGIVVNDSLILVDFINRRRTDDISIYEAVVEGARARLRAILLTSVTTVLGLAPLMFEQSFQAKFLIPMGISIVFGLSIATGLTLVLIPALYLVLEDSKMLMKKIFFGKDMQS